MLLEPSIIFLQKYSHPPLQLRLPRLRKVAPAQRRRNLVHRLQDPRAALVAREPPRRAQLALVQPVLRVRAVLQGLAQAKHVRQHLRADARLRAQARHRDDARQHAAQSPFQARRVGEQRGVVAVQDVHRQVRVRARELGVQLGVKRRVHRVPEGAAPRRRRLEVGGRRRAGGRRAELRRYGVREGGVEGVEAVDGPRDAVEGYALEADLADQLGGRGRRRGDAV